MEIKFKATIQTLNSQAPPDTGSRPTVKLTLQTAALTESQVAAAFGFQSGDPVWVIISFDEPEGVQLGLDLDPDATQGDPWEETSDPGVPAAFETAFEENQT